MLSLRKRRAIDDRGTRLWRALLPSWRFFEAPDVSYLLLARTYDEPPDERNATPFIPVIRPRPHGAATCLFAPVGNLVLACHGLVEQLLQELSEREAFPFDQAEQLTSYKRVQHMVGYFLPQAKHYQIKVVVEQPDGSPGEEVFLSPVYTRP